MPLDPLAKRFLKMMTAASKRDRPLPTLDERRQALAKLMQFARTDAPAVTSLDGVLPGPAGDIPYRLYAPDNDVTTDLPGFVFFHGGGMVAGSIETHDPVCVALAQATGCRLVSVGYRLAPEHQFPAAVEDAIAATRWVAAQASSLGIDATKTGGWRRFRRRNARRRGLPERLAKRRTCDFGAVPDMPGA